MERDALHVAAWFLMGSTATAAWLLAIVGLILGASQLSAAGRLAPGGHGRGPVVDETGATLRPDCPLPPPRIVVPAASGRFVFDDATSGRFAAAWGAWNLEGRSALITDLRVEPNQVVLVTRIPRGHVLFFVGWVAAPTVMAITLPFAPDPPPWYVSLGGPLLLVGFGGLIARTNLRRGRRFAARWAVEIRDAIEEYAGFPPRPSE